MHGVQVVILGVPNAAGRPHGVSRHLVRAADELNTIGETTIDETVTKIERPVPVPAPPPSVTSAPVPVAEPAVHVPSPLDLAGKRPAPVQTAPAAVLAYSGVTGGPSHVVGSYAAPENVEERIDAVVGNLLTSLRTSAIPDDLESLLHGRPSIPREIDKALLDLSDALGLYDLNDLNDTVRYALRSRFWEIYDESP